MDLSLWYRLLADVSRTSSFFTRFARLTIRASALLFFSDTTIMQCIFRASIWILNLSVWILRWAIVELCLTLFLLHVFLRCHLGSRRLGVFTHPACANQHINTTHPQRHMRLLQQHTYIHNVHHTMWTYMHITRITTLISVSPLAKMGTKAGSGNTPKKFPSTLTQASVISSELLP